MNYIKKYFPIGVILVLALAAGFFVLNYKAGSAQEPKNPILCPPGQEEQAGCKWCQHRVTGNCMWLPAVAVAGPWVEVSPPGYCPPLQAEDTPTATVAPTATATTQAIVTLTATATSETDPTQDPGITQQPPATPEPRPRPPHPGGSGNLGYIVLGATVLLGLLASAALLLTRIGRKQY
jgi:hypothetical protein